MAKARRGLPGKAPLERARHYVDAMAQPRAEPIGQALPLASIEPNPEQPRRRFEDIEELARSIREKGVLEPVLVRPAGERYRLVAGERRYRAAERAGLETLPAIVLHAATDRDALEIALVENLQRRDLTPFEEADALTLLRRRYGYTQAQVAARLGKSRSSVAEILKLAGLPAEVREACERAGVDSRSTLLELAKLKDARSMLEAVQAPGPTRPTREALKASRKPRGPGRPPNYVFRQVLPNRARLELRFTKARVSEAEVVETLRAALAELTRSRRKR